MEGSLRGKDFFLPSGRVINLPKNLVFLATMNPEDRSVDEIDSAMERRWAKLRIAPSTDKLREFLEANGMKGAHYGPILDFFNALQPYLETGHAFFRKVKDASSLERLWTTQLEYAVKKRYRFEPDTLNVIVGLWQKCKAEIKAAEEAVTNPAPTT
jgi:5-methylcytosine-specific restriction protein B